MEQVLISYVQYPYKKVLSGNLKLIRKATTSKDRDLVPKREFLALPLTKSCVNQGEIVNNRIPVLAIRAQQYPRIPRLLQWNSKCSLSLSRSQMKKDICNLANRRMQPVVFKLPIWVKASTASVPS